MSKKLYLFTLALMALLPLACAGASLAPGAPAPTQEPFTAEATQSSSGEPFPTATLNSVTQATAAPTQLPAILEARQRLTLEWPAVLRQGDFDRIRLTIEIDAQGNLTPTAEVAGHQLSGTTVQIPNLYATHNVMAEARLDMAGMDISPRDLVSQPLPEGQPVTFYWSVSAPGLNVYRGTLWLYLRFIPLDGSVPAERVLSAQLIEIRSVSFLGLSSTPARLLGGAGALVGSAISLESVLGWLLKLTGRKKGDGKGQAE